MKLKRIIAFVVSMAMVLSIVPAFSLTVSAAEYYDDVVYSYAKTTTAVFDATNPAPAVNDEGYADTISTAWPNSDWSETDVANVSQIDIYNSRIRVKGLNSGTDSAASKITSAAGYGAGADFVLLSFTTEFNNAAKWGDIGIRDIDGKLVTAFRFGSGDDSAFSPVWGHIGYGSLYANYFNALAAKGKYSFSDTTNQTGIVSETTAIDVLIRNIGSNLYTATFYRDGIAFTTATYEGSFNGVKTIEMSVGNGTANSAYLGLQDLKIYAGSNPSTLTEVTATYYSDADSDGVNDVEYTKTQYLNTSNASVTSVTFDGHNYAPNGVNGVYMNIPEQTLSASGSIDITPYKLANVTDESLVGTPVQGDGVVYTYTTGTNLISNGDFSNGLTGWYNSAGTEATTDYFTVNNDGTVTATASTNATGAGSLYRVWDVEVGKTYVLTYTSDVQNMYQVVSEKSDFSETTDGNVIGTGKAGTNTFLFTAEEEYVQVNFRWLGGGADTAGNTIGNFALYEMEVLEVSDEVTSAAITYTIDGEKVHSETKYFITANYPDGYPYEYTCAPNGLNYVYKAEGQATSDVTVEMTPLANISTKTAGDTFVDGNAVYSYLTGENFIPNGDFAQGLLGWYNGAGTAATTGKFTANNDGTVSALTSESVSSEGSLYRAWKVDVHTTYVLEFTSSVSSDYIRVSSRPDLTSTGDGEVLLAKSVEGNNFIVFTARYDYVMINFRWLGEGTKVGNFGLYAVEQTGRAATVTYTVDGAEVGKVTEEFGLTDFGANFEPYYYSANGSNVLYTADDVVEITEDTTVEMTTTDNWSEKTIGDTFTYTSTDEEGTETDTTYTYVSENLVPNGNFEHGLTGWYNGTGAGATEVCFKVNEDSTVTVKTNGNSSSASALQRSWAIEEGKTYVFTYYQDADPAATDNIAKWQRLSLGNDFANNNNAMLSGAGTGDVETGQSVVLGTNTVVFTNTEGYKYANFRAGYSNGTSMGSFALYEIVPAEKTVTVTYTKDGEEVDSVTATYNTAEYPDGYTFEHYHYSENGSNVMYFAEDVTTHYDVTVELEIAENWAGKSIGEYVMHERVESVEEPSEDSSEENTEEEAEGEIPYQIISGNLIPNGNFEHKLTGWYNGKDYAAGEGEFTVNNNGTITIPSDAGADNYQSLYRYWKVEVGKTYLLTYTSSVDHSFQKIFGTNTPAPTATTPDGGADIKIGSVAGENIVVFTAEHDYVQMDFYYGNRVQVGNFGLYEVSSATMVTVEYVYDLTPNDKVDNTGEVVHTVTTTYVNSQGAWVEDYYYSPLSSHVMYKVPGQYVTKDTTLDVYRKEPSTGAVLTRVANWSHEEFEPTSIYTDPDTGKSYIISSRNLVPNGNFEHGLETWYNGSLGDASDEYFEVNADDGTITFLTDCEYNTAGSLFEIWEVEAGATYLAVCYASEDWDGGLITFREELVYDESVVDYNDDETHKMGALKAGDDDTVVIEVPEGMNYVQLNIAGKEGLEFGSMGLYKLEELVPFGESYPLRTTVIDGNEPVLPEYVVVEGNEGLHRVAWDAGQLNSLVYGENFVDGYDPDGNKVITAVVEVYPMTTSMEDQDSYDGQGALNSNNGNKAFEKPLTGKFAVEMDVELHENGDLWVILNDDATTNNWYFHSDQILLGFYFDGEFMAQNGYGDGTREDPAKTLMVTGVNKPYRLFVKGDTEADQYSVTITSPEGTSKTFTDLGFRTVVDQITSVAMLTNSNGTGSFTATNIKVYDPDVLNAQFVLGSEDAEDNKGLGTIALGDYFYGEEIAPFAEGKFYTSYYDESADAYVTEGTDADGNPVSVSDNHNMAHIVKITEEQSFTITPDMTPNVPLPVYVQMHKEHAVLYDTFATNNANEKEVSANLLFAGANDESISDAPNVDDDGNAVVTGGYAMGSPRIPLLTFNIPEFNEGEVVMLNLYAYQANQNLGDGSMKIAVSAVDDTLVNEATDYLPGDVADLNNLIWSDGMITKTEVEDGNGRGLVDEATRRVAIDVTDLLVQAKDAGKDRITLAVYAPAAGAYIMNRESTVYGGVHQGDFAGFLEVENDTYTIKVQNASKVTKNGSKVQLVESSEDNTSETTIYIRNKSTMALYSDRAEHVAFVDDDNIAVYKEGTIVKPVESSESVRPVALGLAMVNGAQVRYGDGVNEETGKLNSGNGLRFITVVDRNDTLAGFVAENEGTDVCYTSEDFVMGTKITADGSSSEVYISATQMQNENIYTSALTNLAESNYNRNFTAVPYIKVSDDVNGEVVFEGETPVVRSIYRVATGILATHETYESGDDYDCDDGDYSLDNSNLLKVLYAYVNHVGIRLTYNPNAEEGNVFTARETGSGAYAHLEGEEESAFFDVSYVDNEDGSYTVTITPMASYETPVEIQSWWIEYVRINNNNSKVQLMIADDWTIDETTGALTFTFTPNTTTTTTTTTE